MKIKTAPFFPASDLSECSAPSASGSLKSSITVPMAGGGGRSLVLPLPATAAKAMTIIEARNIGNAKCFFILLAPFNDGWRVTGKISSQKLSVASDEIVRAGAFGRLVRTWSRHGGTSVCYGTASSSDQDAAFNPAIHYAFRPQLSVSIKSLLLPVL